MKKRNAYLFDCGSFLCASIFIVATFGPSIVLAILVGYCFKLFAPKFFPNYRFSKSFFWVIMAMVVVFVLSIAYLDEHLLPIKELILRLFAILAKLLVLQM